MREIVALLVLYAASSAIDFELQKPSFFTGMMLLICLGALVFLAAAIAERLNPKIKKWHRITPGSATKMDEEEWRKIGENAPKSGGGFRSHSAHSAKSPPPNVEDPPPPPKPKTGPVFYDSGFDASAGETKKEEGPDQFDEIFGNAKK